MFLVEIDALISRIRFVNFNFNFLRYIFFFVTVRGINKMIRYFFAKFDKYCLFVLIINLFYDILTFVIITVNVLILLYLYKNYFF